MNFLISYTIKGNASYTRRKDFENLILSLASEDVKVVPTLLDTTWMIRASLKTNCDAIYGILSFGLMEQDRLIVTQFVDEFGDLATIADIEDKLR